MYDMHTHTNFSDDGSYSMEIMAQAAYDKGLSAICFTDHLDLDHPFGDALLPYNYEGFISELKKTKAVFAREKSRAFKILIGVEMGLQPKALESCRSFLVNKEYDFIIGSMHVIKGVDMYTSEYRDLGNSQLLTEYYFEDLIQCLTKYDDFSVLGHLDVIRRYLHKKDDDYNFEKERENLTKVFKLLIQKGKGIEVNTSGLRYELDSSTPGPKAVGLYKKLGGEIITLGSDAHRPKDVGFMFAENAEMLKAIGFKYGCYFEKLKPIYYKL